MISDWLAIKHLVNRTSETTGIDLTFLKNGDTKLLPNVEIHLYRIVQEALSNIERYSTASKGTIQLYIGNEKAVLKIEDNGKGFNTQILNENRSRVNSGNGLANIRERVLLGFKKRITIG